MRKLFILPLITLSLLVGCVSSSTESSAEPKYYPEAEIEPEITSGDATINALEACIIVAELFESPPTDGMSIQMEILEAQSLLAKASNGSDIYREMFNSLSDFTSYIEQGDFDSAKRASDRFFAGCDTFIE